MKTLVRYRPGNLDLFKDFDAVMNSFFGDDLGLDTRTPAVDIREEDEKYVLEAELAGLSEKDIDIDVENDMLTISSEKKDEKEEKKDGYILKERHSSSFRRSFMLPKEVDAEKINATVSNGVLSLDMPKRPEAKPRKIAVKSK
ncbi:MAG: Hsp20/alpha crystallin family protein [Spirochaetia bacterium]